MNMLLKKLLSRYMAPAGDDGSDTGGADTAVEDRGDDFTPTEDGATAEDGQATDTDGAAAGEDAAAGADDTGQGGADAGEGAEDERTHRAPGIPKTRFNEVNERKKALESENEQLRRELAAARAAETAQSAAPVAPPASQQQAEAAAFDVTTKEQEFVSALIDGDTQKAAKIRGEINAHLVDQATERAEGNIARRSAVQSLKAEVDSTLEQYPWLDTAAGADALELIMAARDRSIAQGVAPHLALRAAVAKIAPRFAPEDDQQPPSGGLSQGAERGDTRSSNAVKRGAADQVAQPPALQVGVGNRASPSARVDVAALDDEQFAALSPAEKSRLRGD